MSAPLIPDNAPFSSAQRAWLNGFFAGMVSVSSTQAAQPVMATVPAPVKEEEAFPWHDPALPMDERLKLAEGKPAARVLMAAMAQLDCGACGYVCQTYAEAIADGADRDVTKCVPGGGETTKKLRELVQVTARKNTAPPPATARPASGAYDRNNPYPARLLSCRRLNTADSSKDTRHAEFGLAGSGLAYKPGDALGVFAENCPDEVLQVLELLSVSGAEDVPAIDGSHTSLHEALLRERSITRPSEESLELLQTMAPSDDEARLRSMREEDHFGELQIIDLLREFPKARPAAAEFIAALSPLQPRLYSISSSPLAHPDQVHLTVGAVRYRNRAGRRCKGVASTYLADRVRPGQKVHIFLQPSRHFELPKESSTPIIMVGPGTGIAPFRAFLHHRKAVGATGQTWLFFGDQRSAGDFLYRDELLGMHSDKTLTRLDTAFSRDQQEKIYVQHRMLENAAELWRWLQDGAHFYVCGDAKRMAKDVDAALHQIVREQGGMDEVAARAFVKELSKHHRYQRDVY
jgi:sulfite reductase (NADPH) flavoprotein alpha-component